MVQTYPLFLNMDAELRVHFLLLLRPIIFFDQEYLYEALDTGSEAYFLVQGNLETWIYENQVPFFRSMASACILLLVSIQMLILCVTPLNSFYFE